MFQSLRPWSKTNSTPGDDNILIEHNEMSETNSNH